MMPSMSSFHGGIDPYTAQEAGINPADIRDFSISINPAPLPHHIREVIGEAALYRYPDPDSKALVQALSATFGTLPEQIIVVNGTSQSIFLLAAAYLKPGDRVLISGPTYGEYRDACRAYGAEVVEITATEERQFRPDTDYLCDEIRRVRPVLFWICNPNSPTGAWIEEGERDRLAAACRDAGCRMIVDEAYAKFAPIGLLPATAHPDVIYLHSMTKDFCIPGLRLGWVRAPKEVIDRLRIFQPDWSVSAPAQDAGTAFMDEMAYFEESWAKTRSLTRYLADGLKKLGLDPVPGAGNFILVKIGDDASVKSLSDRLWKKLIMVRDCASFGLKGYIRIGTRSREDVDEFLTVLKVHLENAIGGDR